MSKLSLIYLFILLSLGSVACGTTTTNRSPDDHASSTIEHEENHSDQTGGMVPNNGATIQILSPVNDTTFKTSDSIKVEVELTNFELTEGNHWHVHLNELEYAMVTTNDTSYVVRGLAVGEYELSVHLSNAQHQSLENGDSITIQITE